MTEAHKQKIADGMRKAWERRRALKLAQEAEAEDRPKKKVSFFFLFS